MPTTPPLVVPVGVPPGNRQAAILQSQAKRASVSRGTVGNSTKQSKRGPSATKGFGDGVAANRGDGRDGLATIKEDKKPTVWESMLKRIGNEQQQQLPRRSKLQSVIAPETIVVPAERTASGGTISVLSSVTQDTIEFNRNAGYRGIVTTKNKVPQPGAPTQSDRSSIFRPKRQLRKPFSVPHDDNSTDRLTEPLDANKLSHNGLPPKPRPRLIDRMNARGFVPNHSGSAKIPPPAYRRQAENEPSSASDPAGHIPHPSGKRNALGGMDNKPNAGNFSISNTASQKQSSPLTENLVDGSGDGYDIPSKIPSSDGIVSRLRQLMSNRMFFYVALFIGMFTGLVYGVLSNTNILYALGGMDSSIDWDEELNVAFIGNSYLFVNDIPRVMEALSENHIHQESVIHSSGGSLGNLLLTGNGMYPRWKTDEAVMDSYVNDNGNNVTIYDYGLCSVAQILQGYDEILSYGNEDGAYYNDGKNPCIRNQAYFNYIDDKLSSSSFEWDYVVLVGQTKRMAVEEARQQSIYALSNAYGPLIEATGAIPVIVDTHAFWSDATNMTGLGDIPTFQGLIYEGVLDYVEALASVLPDWQAPVIAPVGLAFLVVYEERKWLWKKLFIDDAIHSSVYGSYLFACVLYATLFGHLPPKNINTQTELVFADSRLLVGQDIEYPSTDVAFYLWNVAKRVALDGYIPRSMARR